MKKVLVIEDDRDICELIEMILENDYVVHLCSAVDDALRVLSSEKFDLVIVDFILANTTAENIISVHPDEKYLVISAFSHTNPNIMRLLYNHPSLGFLQKPFDVGTFRNSVRSLL